MKRELEITIKGNSASGKSTIALLIEKLLKENGFDVEMGLKTELISFETEEQFREIMSNNWDDRIDGIKEKTKIKINQVQTVKKILGFL